MSEIAQEVERIDEAREGPTMRLLNQKWASFTLAVFQSSFSGQTKEVRAERLHAQVDSYLDELGSLGYEIPPSTQGRGLCSGWVRSNWLKRVPAADGGEAYELTSHALAAQRVVEGLCRERALLSESRLKTILDAVRRWAMEADPDRNSRIKSLDNEIERLTAERDRLAAGGELLRAGADRMLTGYVDMMDLLDQLPGDFRRVEESLEAIHRQMIKDFRAEERPKGEVLDAYLASSEQLTSQTEEGLAFEGALTILNDKELLDDFRDDLRMIMDHPFSGELRSEDKREFLNAASVLRQGLSGVQAQQHKASRSLAEHLASHDSAQERELTQVLRQLQREVSIWMESARPRDYVPLPWMPTKTEIEHLKTSFYDPAADRPTAPLEDVSGEAPEPLSLDEVRRHGGPLLDDVRAGVAGALREGTAATLGAAFNELQQDLRRPVEVFGLMHLAAAIGVLDGGEQETEVVETVRPDGTARRLLMPRLDLTAEQVLQGQGSGIE